MGALENAGTGAGIGASVAGPYGAVIGGAAGLIGGWLGDMFGSDDTDKAEEARKRAAEIIDQLDAPPELQKQIIMEQFQNAGLYSPQLEQAVNDSVSQVSKVQESPQLKNAQMRALESLQKQGRVGLSATDRMALNKVRAEVQRDTEAKRQQIIQNMQARGQSGGGVELAAQLQAAQGGSDQASEAGDRLAAMAQERALAAIGQSGALGGQIRAQDFDVNRAKAAAADEMNRFNVQNAINRQMRNVSTQNQGQMYNLQNAQQLANANTAQANAEKLRQSAAAHQYWADKVALGGMKANAATGQAVHSEDQAAQQAQRGVQIGSGVGTAVGGLANYLNSKPSAPEAPKAQKTQAQLNEDELNKV